MDNWPVRVTVIHGLLQMLPRLFMIFNTMLLKLHMIETIPSVRIRLWNFYWYLLFMWFDVWRNYLCSPPIFIKSSNLDFFSCSPWIIQVMTFYLKMFCLPFWSKKFRKANFGHHRLLLLMELKSHRVARVWKTGRTGVLGKGKLPLVTAHRESQLWSMYTNIIPWLPGLVDNKIPLILWS